MSDPISAADAPTASSSAGGGIRDAARIAEVKAWLSSQFDALDEMYQLSSTPRSVAHLHSLATLSQSRSRSAAIVAADLRLKASEYHSQVALIREILDAAGLSHERLSPPAIASAQVIATVANLLNIIDTEMSSFAVAMGDLFLRRFDVKEERVKVDKESKMLLDCTRKGISKLAELKKTLLKFENEVGGQEAHMHLWENNLAMMDSKERQYMLQRSNYEARHGINQDEEAMPKRCRREEARNQVKLLDEDNEDEDQVNEDARV